jgi:lipopolysaccharide export system protein LptA
MEHGWWPMKGLAWLALALAAGQGGKMLYEDKDHLFGIYDYTSGGGEGGENGEISFDIKGNPVRIESRLQGLTMKGPEMKGTVGQVEDPKDKKRSISFVKSLLATGNPVVLFNSSAQHKAQVAQAEKYKLEPPKPLAASNTAELKTAELTYTGTAAEGTFTMPKAFTLNIGSEGKKEVEVKGKQGEKPQKVVKNFTVTGTVTGSSGTVNLDPSAQGNQQLQNGKIEGPIDIDMVQEEITAPSTVPVLTTMKGKADRMEFDLKETHTITLYGNVKVTYSNGIYEGTTEGVKVVVTLDPVTLKPIKYTFTGDPAKTVAKKSGGGKK